MTNAFASMAQSMFGATALKFSTFWLWLLLLMKEFFVCTAVCLPTLPIYLKSTPSQDHRKFQIKDFCAIYYGLILKMD